MRLPSCVLLAAATASALVVAAPPSHAQQPARAAVAPAVTTVGTDAAGLVTPDQDFSAVATAMAEPALGRLEFTLERWRPAKAGRYLHVVLGTLDGGACQASRRLVIEPGAPTEEPTLTAAYDGSGAPITPDHVYQLQSVPAYDGSRIVKMVARVQLPPFADVDCVRATGRDSSSPTTPGPVRSDSEVQQLTVRTWGDGSFPHQWPVHVGCPEKVPYDSDFAVTATVSDTTPDLGTEALWSAYPVPSHVGPVSIAYSTLPDDAVVVTPADPVGDVDLWADPAPTLTTTLHQGTTQKYWTHLGAVTITLDGTTRTEQVCGAKRQITWPVPTDWEGTLGGTTLWREDSDRTGEYSRSTYRFDDEWLYYGGGAASCTHDPVVDSNDGCDRYYYDAATRRLQLYDRLIPRNKDRTGWYLGTRRSDRQEVLRSDVVLPARTGQRFAYQNDHWHFGQNLTLSKDGGFRLSWWSYAQQRRHGVSGHYRFLGGDRQRLVLRIPGTDFEKRVRLYYGKRDGQRVLVGLTAGDIDVSTDHPTYSESNPLR
ncbi:MAG TPA: hypothetical protein VNS55_10325 [Nocardioides sp.]|nr:hypothetical protein [Nocardioides sp.]